MKNSNNGFGSFDGERSTDKVEQLKKYVEQSEYIDFLEQRTVCKSFGLPYLKKIFQEVYRKRAFDYLEGCTTTMATVSLDTGIPHKYLTEVKVYYEDKGLLQVVALGKCPTTGSLNVQFVTTNPKIKSGFEPPTNQFKLFKFD